MFLGDDARRASNIVLSTGDRFYRPSAANECRRLSGPWARSSLRSSGTFPVRLAAAARPGLDGRHRIVRRPAAVHHRRLDRQLRRRRRSSNQPVHGLQPRSTKESSRTVVPAERDRLDHPDVRDRRDRHQQDRLAELAKFIGWYGIPGYQNSTSRSLGMLRAVGINAFLYPYTLLEGWGKGLTRRAGSHVDVPASSPWSRRWSCWR